MINEAKIEQEQENSSVHHPFVRKEKARSGSDLISIMEVDDEKDEEETAHNEEGKDGRNGHIIQKDVTGSGDAPSTPKRAILRSKRINANSMSVLRQRCELDAATRGRLYVVLNLNLFKAS